ncbi:MAG: transcription elongation factor GreA [Rhodothermales bacterium]
MAEQNTKPVYLTKEALQQFKDELHHLRTAERARIAKAIAEARSHGDLAENAEYDAAKEAQGQLEARIAKIEQTISNARIVDEAQIDASKAFILSRVRIKNHKSGSEQLFTLVSEEEADITQGKISITSPIGKGLLGRSVGETVEITVPAGKVKLEILEITR